MYKSLITNLILAVFALVFMQGCAHKIRIVADPPEANVSVNDVDYGKAGEEIELPYDVRPHWMWSKLRIKVDSPDINQFLPKEKVIRARKDPGMITVGALSIALGSLYLVSLAFNDTNMMYGGMYFLPVFAMTFPVLGVIDILRCGYFDEVYLVKLEKVKRVNSDSGLNDKVVPAPNMPASVESVFCSSCGVKNERTNTFCKGCGKKLKK